MAMMLLTMSSGMDRMTLLASLVMLTMIHQS
jgi:hypothetical protein